MPRTDTNTGIEHETATEYLERVMRDSENPVACEMAAFALDQYKELMASWKERGVSTRRSLYDLLSGVRNISNKVTHFRRMVPIKSGKKTYYFPVFTETCGYRGKVAPKDAISTGLAVNSERRPQPGKFRNITLKS